MATWHRAAHDGSEVLGDFYDVFPMDEAQNSHGERFGMERLAQLVSATEPTSADVLVASIARALLEFAGVSSPTTQQ